MPAIQQTNRRTAFTLIELMVSLFLMMLIMIGVNSVFSATSATIGTSSAISATNRDARAIQAVLNPDFATAASDAPAINLRCEQQWMYRNQADYNSDPTPNYPGSYPDVTTGAEPAGSPAGSIPNRSAAYLDSRSHRRDRISFFTRQLLRRQTGNDGTYMANQAAMEQWIWIGHLRLPDNTANPVDANFRIPGELNASNVDTAYNPNNLFAQQWVLGRMAMNLVEPVGATSSSAGTINDLSGTSQNFVYRTFVPGPTDLTPLAYNASSTGGGLKLQESRYDLAGTSIAGYSTILSSAIANGAGNWWDTMMGDSTSRFRGIPFASRPLTSFAASQVAPVLAMNCSQFVVEFAGDFLNQDASGLVTDTCMRYDSAGAGGYVPGTTDGLIDYVIPTAPAANAGQRQIRWYGLPRSTSGASSVKLSNGDVVPLRDVWQTSSWNTPATQNQSTRMAPFEHTGGSGGTNILGVAAAADYATSMMSNTGYYYPVAWAPTDSIRPKLIRITITLEDANNRLSDGQTFEYVFALGN